MSYTIAVENIKCEKVVMELTRMGYPEVGSIEGVRAAAAKAKSFVSCAIGRIDQARNSQE